MESVRIRDPCPFRAGVGESTQKIDRSDSFVEMIRLSASLDGHAAMESETTGFGGAKSVIEKEKVQSNALQDDEVQATFGICVIKYGRV